MKRHCLLFFPLLVYSCFSDAIVYCEWHDSKKISLSVQNRLGSKNITITAADLNVKRITGYSVGSDFAIETSEGDFIITDGSFGEGIIINVYAPDASLFGTVGGSYGDFFNGHYFPKGFGRSLPGAASVASARHVKGGSDFGAILAALPDHSFIFHSTHSSYKLSSSLTQSVKFRYLSQFSDAVKSWLARLFVIIPRDRLVPFFSYVLKEEISDMGQRMLLRWYDDFWGSGTSSSPRS